MMAADNFDPRQVDWQQVCLNLRAHFGPMSKVGPVVGADPDTLNRMARGSTAEPKFAAGVNLLDLHYATCPDKHGPAIMKVRR